jgi:hypothetical protein
MDNAEYRQKYERPYSGSTLDKWGRMAKQMVDARHVSGDSGYYIGGAGSNFRQNPAGGAEVGVTNYATPWLSTKLGVAGQVNSGARDAFAGVNTAVHLSTPTRVAPFVGAGLFGGVDVATVINSINSDPSANDEESSSTRFLGAVYPEAGVHVWLNGRTRLSASASYWMTTSSHDREFWYYGLGLTFGFGDDGRTAESGELIRENEFVNRLLEERERQGEAHPAVNLTSAIADEAGNNHQQPGLDEQEDPKLRTDSVAQEHRQPPRVFDRVFPSPPMLLPPSPSSQVLSPERPPVYVEPPND